LEKSDFSNRAQTCPKNEKEIRCPRNPIFLEKSDFSNRAQTCPKNEKEIRAQEIRFFGKIGFLLKTEFINGLDIGAILH
jgi:hypothetical protein